MRSDFTEYKAVNIVQWESGVSIQYTVGRAGHGSTLGPVSKQLELTIAALGLLVTAPPQQSFKQRFAKISQSRRRPLLDLLVVEH